MAVLVCLAENAGEPVSREKLLNTVWPTTFVSEDVLTRSISELRKVLEDDARSPKFIETVAKRGYRVIAPVTAVNGHVVPAGGSNTDLPATSPWRRFAIPALAVLVVTVALLEIPYLKQLGSRLLREPAVQIHSLAVIPLKNLSGDANQDYFADAMTEELITELSHLSGLRVISRTSAMRYKNSDKSLPEIARELNVDAIVEGSILRSGDRVRFTAQLIYAPKDTNVWAETYDRDLKDVLTLQSTVSQNIAREIRVQVQPPESTRLKTPRPVDRKALELYLTGRRHIDTASALEFRKGKEQEYNAEIQKAAESFRESIRQDPNYLPAYLGIFDVVDSAGLITLGELMPEARQGVKKALELDESSVEAHLDLARIFMQWDYDYPSAGNEYKRVLKLAPNSADAHAAYSDYLSLFGMDDESNKELELAQALDPTHNRRINGFPMDWTLDQAREYLDRDTDRSNAVPADEGWLRAVLGKEYQAKGRYKEAVEQYIKTCQMYGDDEQAELLRRSYAMGNYKGAIRQWMARWEELSRTRKLPSFWPAFLYANLGDRDAAFRWLERAYNEHSWCMMYLNVDLMWDPIRSDPRFVEYVRKAGLPADHGQFVHQRELSLLK